MKVRFLLDENLSPRIKQAVQRREPAIDLLRVGDESAPPLGTLDPDILRYLESAQRLLLTDTCGAVLPQSRDDPGPFDRSYGGRWAALGHCVAACASAHRVAG